MGLSGESLGGGDTECTLSKEHPKQGTNASNVISVVYAFFVLQCTVSGWNSKHKTDVTV